MSESDGFSDPSYGGEASWVRVKLKSNKDGSPVKLRVRILPPYKTKNGKWKRYRGLHFGFKGRDTKDATKTRLRPFECVQDKNMRTGVILCECAQCTSYELKYQARKKKMAELMAKGKSEKEAQTLTQDLGTWLKDYNNDRKWEMAVMLEDERFAFLTLSHKSTVKLEAFIKKMKDERQIDPLKLSEGLWIEITRTGTGTQADDSFDFVPEMIEVQGQRIPVPKKAPLSRAQIDRALEVLPPLDEINVKLTPAQIERLVECSGDPEEVDAIFNLGQKADAPKKPSETRKAAQDAADKELSKPVEDTAAVGAVDDEEAQLAREEAEMAAKRAALAAKKAAAAAAPKTESKTEASPPKSETKVNPGLISSEPSGDDDDMLDDQAFLEKFKDPSKG